MDGWTQETVTIPKAKLQCPVCTHPLKPPIFQCAAGHLACGACHAQLADKERCYSCAHPGGYSHNLPLEEVVRSTRTLCPYLSYGCYSCLPLYEMGEHQPKCPHAPCGCSEPGCAFIGSPAMVCEHLRDTHSWPVYSIDYGGKAYKLKLPESRPRCLLVAKEDEHVFVVSVAALPVPMAALRGVSLACLRCKMWATGSADAATGKVPTVSAEIEVPSSAVAGHGGEAAATETEDEAAATETDDDAALVVHRKMLHGPSKELHLIVVINKVNVQT